MPVTSTVGDGREILMEKNEKRTLIINRVLAFLVGGLLVFAVMSFTVVKSANAENEELSNALDTSRFEAGRLLEDAKAQLSSGDYDKAAATLTSLFANQPGSPEATEGKALLAKVEDEAVSADLRWEAALPSIRAQWTETMEAELRADFEEDRAEFENELEAAINEAWEKARPGVRTEWSEQQQS